MFISVQGTTDVLKISVSLCSMTPDSRVLKDKEIINDFTFRFQDANGMCMFMPSTYDLILRQIHMLMPNTIITCNFVCIFSENCALQDYYAGNNPEELRSHLLCSRSLKSCMFSLMK
jgi:hypothetical protein